MVRGDGRRTSRLSRTGGVILRSQLFEHAFLSEELGMRPPKGNRIVYFP